MTDADKAAITKLVTDFHAALEDGREDVIHAFLKQNTVFLRFLHHRLIKSKFHLAETYVTDFMTIGDSNLNDPRPLVTFIEIERSDYPLFTRAGNPTALLTHAIRQTQDWKKWATDNRTYLHAVL